MQRYFCAQVITVREKQIVEKVIGIQKETRIFRDNQTTTMPERL